MAAAVNHHGRAVVANDHIPAMIHNIVRSAVDHASGAAIDNNVPAAIHHIVRPAVHDVIRPAIYNNVPAAVHNIIRPAVHNVIRPAVHDMARPLQRRVGLQLRGLLVLDLEVRAAVHDDRLRRYDDRLGRNDNRRGLVDAAGRDGGDRGRDYRGCPDDRRHEERLAVPDAVEVHAGEAAPIAFEDHRGTAVVPAPELADFIAALVDHAKLVFLLGVGGRVEVDHDVQVLLRARLGRRGGAGPRHVQPGDVRGQMVDVPRRNRHGRSGGLRRGDDRPAQQEERRAAQEKRSARQQRPVASHSPAPSRFVVKAFGKRLHSLA
jgi:hypothetical protein